jgi:curved DNA-binding protein CbpA
VTPPLTPSTRPASATPPSGTFSRPPDAPRGASPPATPERPLAQTADAAEVRELILGTHEGLLFKDHFELLGVPPTATDAEIRLAHARFARMLHPDACRGLDLDDLREQREAVFFRVSQAYKTLSNPVSRAAYQREIEHRSARRPTPTPPPPAAPSLYPPPPAAAPRPATAPAPAPSTAPATAPATAPEPPVAPSVEALVEEGIRRAEELIAERMYWEAIQQLEPLIRRVEGPLRVRARLALALASSKNPKWLRRAEEQLQAAIHEDPRHVEAHLLLASIYRTEGLPARAAAVYRRILEIKPGHPKALRELAQQEHAEAEPPSGGLRGFFKKREHG